jgi:N-acetyl sugar amidotransferase
MPSRVDQKIQESIDRQLENQPREVRFCRRCVLSNQRPRLVFDEDGICSACRYAERKERGIDWTARGRELRELCDRHRRSDGRFDVVVPGSGGKDSAAVTDKLKVRYGMHPLTVTWSPFMYTDIGWQNFQRFVQAGFTNLMGTPNGHLHRKLAKAALIAVGDPFVPFIYGQLAFGFHIALRFGIPLLFFGENGEVEYGGSTRYENRGEMPLEDWAELYFKGITVDDLVEWALEHGMLKPEDYTDSDLLFYRPPPFEEIKAQRVQMHWFSYYEKWVPQENFYHAVEHSGFQPNPEGRSEGTYSKYASLDDKLDGLHYYFSLVKFGIGRATSDAAHEVRDAHLTRDEAVGLVRRFDAEFPRKHLRESLEYLDMTEPELWEVIDAYRARRPHLWEQTGGEWRLRHQVASLDPSR